MRFLARAVAILCLSTVVSCSEDNPTRPSTPQPPLEGTVQVSVLDRDGNAMALETYFSRLDDERGGEPIKFAIGPDAPEVRLPVGNYFVFLSPYTGDLGIPVPDLGVTERANRLDYPNSGPPISGTTQIQGAPLSDVYPGVRIPDFRVNEGVNHLDYRYSGSRIAGTAQFQGAPLSAVSINLYSSGKNVAHQLVRDGRYSLVMPPGDYEIQAVPSLLLAHNGLPGLVTYVRRPLTLPDEDVTQDFDFTGHETRIVVIRDGAPVSNAGVAARGVEATAYGMTDGEGSIMRFLPTGEYTFELTYLSGLVPLPTLAITHSITEPGTVTLDLTAATVDARAAHP